MAGRPQFQFSVASLLLTSTVLAVVLAIVAALDIPFSNPAVRGFLGSYFIFVAIWTVIRGPRVFGNLSDVARRRRELRDKRSTIERELREIKAARSPRDDSPAPQAPHE
jgi:hypothetical protein